MAHLPPHALPVDPPSHDQYLKDERGKLGPPLETLMTLPVVPASLTCCVKVNSMDPLMLNETEQQPSLIEPTRPHVPHASETATDPAGTGSPESAGHPLGPLVEIVALDHPLWGRLYALLMTVALGALLGMAIYLKPHDRHMGTHRQLGLPPCGFVLVTGFPCPTCGMTTAFSHTVRGQVLTALYAQPAGTLLALGSILFFVLSLLAVVTGHRPSLNLYRVDPVRLVLLGALFIMLSWGWKCLLGLMDQTLPIR